MAQKQLYRKLRVHPALLLEAEELEDFKALYEAAPFGYLDAANAKTEEMTRPNSTLSAPLHTQEALVGKYITHLQKEESEYLTAPDYEYLDDLNVYKASVASEGDSILGLLRQSRAAIAAWRAPLRVQALAQNAAVTGSGVWITNEKIVNSIYLQTIASGQAISPTQQATLAAIAAQCPANGR